MRAHSDRLNADSDYHTMQRATIVIVALWVVLEGCATYRAAPVDDAFVNSALDRPSLSHLRVAAASLKHPYLHPIELDFSDGLSAAEAAVVAVIANPELRAARAERGIATAQLIDAGILPNPELAAGVEFPVNDTTGAATAVSLGLSINLLDFFARPVERSAARAASARVSLDIAWQEWQVAQAARQQAYDNAFLSRQVTLADEQERALGENLRVLTEARNRNLVRETDRAAAETAYLDAHSARLELQVRRDTTRLGLLKLMGFPPDADDIFVTSSGIPFETSIDTLRPGDSAGGMNEVTDHRRTDAPGPVLPRLDSLMAGLEDRRLDIVALRYGCESQDARLRVAILRQFPTISIGLTRATNDARLLTLGPGLSVGLPIFNRNQGAVAIESATREKLRQEYAARLFEVRAAVGSLHALYSGLLEQLRASEAAAVAKRRLVDTYGQALRRGNADVLEYYSAQTELLRAEVAVQQYRQALADLTVALETTTGRSLTSPESHPAR